MITVLAAFFLQAVDLSKVDLVDLSHAYSARTLYWPTSPSSFRLDTLAAGQTPGGFYYSAFAFSTPEHGGTHLDAPVHFDRDGLTADRIPLTRLIARAERLRAMKRGLQRRPPAELKLLG